MITPGPNALKIFEMDLFKAESSLYGRSVFKMYHLRSKETKQAAQNSTIISFQKLEFKNLPAGEPEPGKNNHTRHGGDGEGEGKQKEFIPPVAHAGDIDR